ncbi:hypothetical protein [Helicobacter trogontum]|nr:hypothetical protein [Helicobacter trogontum]MDY5185278.1 hypothetical protein [Helicobacter trogontum]
MEDSSLVPPWGDSISNDLQTYQITL